MYPGAVQFAGGVGVLLPVDPAVRHADLAAGHPHRHHRVRLQRRRRRRRTVYHRLLPLHAVQGTG